MVIEMKKKTRVVLCILLCVSFICNLSLPVYAAEQPQKTVRVAYFDLGTYYQAGEEGTVNSYDAAWLDMVGEYTGLQFEYVDCGTWNQALKMLDRHEVDLVGTMQWTQEREASYEICDASYGYTIAELAAAEDSDVIYEDYKAIDQATVGYIEGYVVQNQLQSLMEEKNLHFRLKTYKSQQELDDALETGEIDLVAANAHAIHENWKVVEKFAYAPFYFASWKGNSTLTETISQAIIKINVHQANFDDNLIRQYFPVMVYSPYNKEEMDCIEKEKTYTVYLDANAKPMVYYDKNTDSMSGVLVEICNLLEENTGLKFNIVPTTDKEGTNTDSDTKVTCRTLYYGAVRNASSEEGVTGAILDQNFALYRRIGDNYEADGKYSIAIARNRDGLEEYLNEKFPECTLVSYDTPEECLKEVSRGRVNLAFVNTYIADNFIIEDSLNKLTDVPMTEVTFGIALQFYGEDAQVLSEIVDKGIKLVDSDTINQIMLGYTINITPKMSLRYLLQQHFWLVFFWLLILIGILIVCIILLAYAQMMKKERNRMAEINRERTDFFARMSHDMRTPMNGILGMLALTKRTDNMEEIQNNTRKAEQSGRYMLSLINDTLDLQRLESNKLTLEPELVLVRDFIENIIEMIKPSADQKNIRFLVNKKKVQEDFYINIDPVRVKQIFVNILSNAVKFSSDGGIIQTDVTVIAFENKKADVKVKISDTGIGMTKDYVENSLFKPYSQEHNRVTSQYAGSGLGLAIVKNLVELMGGSIHVKSELGEGTVFTIRLSLPYEETTAVQENVHTKSTQEEREDLKGKKILICEDHPLNAEITQKLLNRAGCLTTVACDGAQGVECFVSSAQNEFDAILMDIRMPVMDGLTAAKEIRASDREDAKTVPIIAMTANAYDTDRENSANAGMNAHLAKPVDVGELYRVLGALIERRKDEKQR